MTSDDYVTPDPDTLKRIREVEERLDRQTEEITAHCPLCKETFKSVKAGRAHDCPVLRRLHRRFRWWNPRSWWRRR